MRERIAPKVHKSSIFQMVESDSVDNKQSITKLLHSVHVDNKNTSFGLRNSIKAWIDDQNSDSDQIPFSGFLIQRDNSIIHFLESENKRIENFLEFMKDVGKTLKTPMTFQILAFNERYVDRTFEVWGSESVITGETVYPHSNIGEDKIEERIWTIYEKFLVAGKAVKPKLVQEKIFTPILIKQALDYIQITAEEVEGMFSGFSFTLEEYFNVYHASNNILLDNEHMWPVESYVSQLIEYNKEPFTEINGINLT